MRHERVASPGDHGRNRDAELTRFCSIAMGSASELDTTCCRPEICTSSPDYTELARQASEVKRMLTGLIQKLTADR